MDHVNAPILPEFPGLSQSSVKEQRRLHGANRQEVAEHKAWHLFLDILKEPMILLLLVACSMYFILSEWTEAFTMLGAIVFVAGISLIQEYRSQNAVKALQKMTMTRAKVIRDGQLVVLPAEELVVADTGIVEEGDVIPADMVLRTEYDLAVQEAILTGESAEVIKQPGDLLFQGTLVVRGYGYAEVAKVGVQTKLATIQHSLSQVKVTDTPLQSQVRRFVRLMIVAGSGAFLTVWIYHSWATGSIIEGLLQGLTMAMSVIPEEIPVAMTTFLALGAYRLLRLKVIARQPQSVETLGAATVICVDKTGTLTKNLMQVAMTWEVNGGITTDYFNHPALNEVLEYAMWSSELAPFDPMEVSIHQEYEKLAREDRRKSATMLKDFPLSGKPPVMTHIFALSDHRTITACKGGLESVLRLANAGEEISRQAHAMSRQLASSGYRVLGVSKGTWEQSKLPERPEEMEFQFLGLIAFLDPPEAHIKEVIQSFIDAGVRVKMITGDYLETAQAVADQVGIRALPSLTGDQMHALNAVQLAQQVKNTDLFARIYPEAKLRIVQSLIENGEVVAMTGDGVNDAPALKAAHIGIAMGRRGTEVAKAAAGLILADDNLGNMVDAIYLGRRIHANLKKAIRYIISIHIPIILLVVLNILLPFLPETVFTPVHVIFLELIMGPTCSIIYENEPTRKSELQKPSLHRQQANLLEGKLLSITIIQGLMITLACLAAGWWSHSNGVEAGVQRTVIFSTLVLSNVFLTLVNRSFQLPIWKTIRSHNRLIPLILLISLTLWLITLLQPEVRSVFGFAPVGWDDLTAPFLLACIGTLWIEPLKAFGWIK